MNCKHGLIILVAASFGCKKMSQMNINYPTILHEPVTDVIHGHQVIDEFRILENLQDSSVQAWIKQQNILYDSVLKFFPEKSEIINDIKAHEYSSNVRATMPRGNDSELFFRRVKVKENETSICRMNVETGTTVEIFNTNSLPGGNTYVIDYCEPSPNGKLLATGISKNGTEMSTLCLVDAVSGKIQSDTIPLCMYGRPAWKNDNSGFYYNQLNSNAESLYENSKVKFHTVGTNPRLDKETFSKSMYQNIGLESIDFPTMLSFPFSNTLICKVYHGSSSYCINYICDNPFSSNPKWIKLNSLADKVVEIAYNGRDVYFCSFRNSPNGQIIKLNTATGIDSIVLNDSTIVLQEMIQNKRALFVKYLKNGTNGVVEIDLQTDIVSDLPLPVLGSVTLDTDGRTYFDGNDMYFGLESWNKEFGTYKFGAGKFTKTNIRPSGERSEAENLIAEEVLVTSDDGVDIPLSIIHDSSVKLDGTNPTILEAYGAFGHIMMPGFRYYRLAWFKRGGVYAVAHVRGGGEKGEQWYLDGFKTKKKNSWLDYLSCAKYLIDRKYTSASNLCALTSSGGAITVGKAMIENPTLFKAACFKVGLLNPARAEFSKNSLGVTEFGSVGDTIEFDALYQMDPYLSFNANQTYPSCIFTAATNDARVDLWQPAKMVAKMQEAKNSSNLVLFRISEQGGHFSDGNFLEEIGEIYSFFLWQTGHKSP